MCVREENNYKWYSVNVKIRMEALEFTSYCKKQQNNIILN